MNQMNITTIGASLSYLICLLHFSSSLSAIDTTAQKTLQDKLATLEESKVTTASLKVSIETSTKDLKAQRNTLKKKISESNQEAKKAIIALQTDIAKKIKDVNDAKKNFEKSLQSSVDKDQAKSLLQQADKISSDHQKAAAALSSLEMTKEIGD